MIDFELIFIVTLATSSCALLISAFVREAKQRKEKSGAAE
jgi:hypothetical protein